MVKRIEGVQSHNKNQLSNWLNKSKHKKQFKIITVKKPKWWFGNWKKLYEIKRK